AGGRLAIHPPKGSTYAADQSTLVGNTVLYGETGGRAFFNGTAGERFGVRNSGATTVVEGVGDHGCEYMTGGLVYVLDEAGQFPSLCNTEMVTLEGLSDADEISSLRALLEEHVQCTGSQKGQRLLDNWGATVRSFVKVFPNEWRRVLKERAEVTPERKSTPRAEREPRQAAGS